MVDRPPLSAEVFDEAFGDAAESEWIQRVFGADLPPGIDAFSFITSDGLDEIVDVLADCARGTIVDLACGRGGPGLWLARRIGASLIGVDWSPVGIEHARSRASESAGDLEVRYLVADAASTGLPGDSVDGLVCIDAIQLMADTSGVMAEVHRLLRPGGRAVFTTWEHPDRLPNLAAVFAPAGLIVVSVEERPGWQARERRIFEQAVADAPRYPDDAGLQSLAEEAQSVALKESRRVVGVARKPLGARAPSEQAFAAP
jgi:SAM-dependent methyltransferase